MSRYTTKSCSARDPINPSANQIAAVNTQRKRVGKLELSLIIGCAALKGQEGFGRLARSHQAPATAEAKACRHQRPSRRYVTHVTNKRWYHSWACSQTSQWVSTKLTRSSRARNRENYSVTSAIWRRCLMSGPNSATPRDWSCSRKSCYVCLIHLTLL